MLTAIVLALFVPVVIFEYITVLRKAEKKVIILHLCIMLISFSVLMLYSFKVTVPSPSDAIAGVLEAIFKLENRS